MVARDEAPAYVAQVGVLLVVLAGGDAFEAGVRPESIEAQK